uniref:Uncharacterized protein n=1 Tax=Arundo donax TaxID=35708 RepID=A0A0A9BVA3_ARUDO
MGGPSVFSLGEKLARGVGLRVHWWCQCAVDWVQGCCGPGLTGVVHMDQVHGRGRGERGFDWSW